MAEIDEIQIQKSSEKGPLFAGQFSDAEIRAAVEEAEARDSYVAVHV